MEPAAASLRIAGADGRTEFEAADTFPPERFGAGRSADVQFDLPLSKAGSGPHLPTIPARRGQTTVSRSVRFETVF